MFFRWEDEHEVFNVEGTGPDFVSCDPDEYYIDATRPWTEEEKNCGALLTSLTPRQELAAFLYMRNACLWANNRWHEARAVLRAACNLHPEHPHYVEDLDMLEAQIACEAAPNPPSKINHFIDAALPEFTIPLQKRRFTC